MRRTWIAAIVMVVFGAMADSQPPTPSYPHRDSTTPQQSELDKKKTENAQIISTFSNEGKAEIDSPIPAKKQNSDKGEAAVDWWPRWSGILAFLVTAAQALVTAAQAWIYWRQTGLMRTQGTLMLEQTRIAESALTETATTAKAAKDTAKAGVDAMRPWIKIDIADNQTFLYEGGDDLSVYFNLENVGKTPAIDVVVQTEISFVPQRNLFADPIPAENRNPREKKSIIDRYDFSSGICIFPGEQINLKKFTQSMSENTIRVIDRAAINHEFYAIIVVSVGYRYGSFYAETVKDFFAYAECASRTFLGRGKARQYQLVRRAVDDEVT